MLVIIIVTIITLIAIWYCPAFKGNTIAEHYAPPKGGAKPAKGGAPPSKGGAPPAKGGAPAAGTLTPDTVISIPLGLLIQYLNKVGAGSIG